MYDTLKPNQLIDITTLGDTPAHFRSLVKVVSGDRIFVELCDNEANPADLIPGMAVRITYADSDATYSSSSEVLSINNGIPVLFTLGKLQDLKRIQRRDFVRMDVKLKVLCSLLDDSMTPIETFNATTLDISGGGIRFGCNVLLSIGQILEAKVSLEDSQSVTGVGEVVRVLENSAAAKFRYTVGLRFTAIKESDRDKIIKFIFNQQRKLRNKGLL